MIRYLPIFIFVFSLFSTSAQVIQIRGKVRDAVTGEPIGYANVYFKKTSVAALADDSGYYKIDTRIRRDSLTATFLGYKEQSKKVILHKSQVINFDLVPNTTRLEEVVIHPGENPAYRIIRNIHKRKLFNTAKTHNMQCEVYNKVQISISNIDEKFKNRRVLRPFQFAFNYTDTDKVTGNTYLPVLITETAKDYYYRREPFLEKEVIKATQVSGINNESLDEFISTLDHKFDIYDDYMSLYQESGFISPIADAGLLFYRYYLVDSAIKSGHKCYHIEFKPRRKQERTFIGDFWVADTTFAIQSLSMKINPEANLNFVYNLVADYEYIPLNDYLWVKKKEHVKADMNVANWKVTKGFQGERTTIFSNHNIEKDVPEEISREEESIIFSDSMKSSSYFVSNRPDSLTAKEKGVYEMVDSIKDVPAFRTVYDVLYTFFGGYYDLGKYMIGPYYSLYSYNKVEGNRFRIGGTTNFEFSDKYKITGFLAYGTKDKEFKYYGNFIWMLRSKPRRISLNTTYIHDLSQVYLEPSESSIENIFSSFFRRNSFTMLQMINNFNTTLEFDLTKSISPSLGLNYIKIYEGPFIPFLRAGDSASIHSVSSAQVKLGIHLESGQHFFQSKFRRWRLRNDKPAFDLTATYSIKGYLESKYEFLKVELKMEHFLVIAPFGFNRYKIEAGQNFGKTPWPLLKVFRGNETYGLEKYCFNMMNLYEFVADRYLSFSSEQHFQGMLLNYIPALRKLKLREVASARFAIGTISKKNSSEFILPPYMHSLNRPYLEAGFGVENIFKFLRVDALWRFTHTKNPDTQVFGIRARLQFML